VNTLSRKVTATFFTNADGYSALVAHWSALMQDTDARKRVTAAHHLLYQALRGKNWQQGFTDVTNTVKLANGMTPGHPARAVLPLLRSPFHEPFLLAPFAGLVTPEALARVRLLLPAYRYDINPLEEAPYRAPEIVSEEAA
jgi:hypothetical protein